MSDPIPTQLGDGWSTLATAGHWVGLQSEAAKDLNEKQGRVLSFSADRGRYDVELAGGQVKAIKPDNLRRLEK